MSTTLCDWSSFVCVFFLFLCVWSEAAGKGAKAGGGGAGGDNDELAPSRLDIRVGKIVSVEKVGRQDHQWSASSDDVCWDDPPVSQSSVFVHMFICCPPHSIQMPTRCTWRRLMWERRSRGRWSAGSWPIFHRRTYRTGWCWCCAIWNPRRCEGLSLKPCCCVPRCECHSCFARTPHPSDSFLFQKS